MKKKFYNSSAFFIILLAGFSINSAGQCTINYLQNASFENPAQSTLGNNFPGSIPNWNTPSGIPNLVKVDGVTDYFGGPNGASDGTQYLDIAGSSGTFTQSFVLGCTADLTFRGDFSSREGGATWTAQIDIRNSLGVIVATSTTRNFTTADADNAVPPGPDAVWYTMSGTANTLPAGTYTYEVTLDDFGNFDNAFLCASPGCLLPVKLKSVEASLNNCTVTINWAVESETNFKNYLVEYSQNGTDFSSVGIIPGTALASPKNYSFKHLPTAGKAFYRLKMVDIDGKTDYSKTLLVISNCNKDAVLLYPNPVTDILTINVQKFSTRQSSVASLYNITGELVNKIQLINGANTIDMRNMPSGLYHLVLINNDQITSYKIQRQ